MSTLVITIFTSIILSKLIFEKYPAWFLLTTTGISAFSTLFASLLNFFYIKDKILNLQKRIHFIKAEIIKYNNKSSKKYKYINKDYYLFTSIAAHSGNVAARKEIGIE